MANFLARRACQTFFRSRLVSVSALALPARQQRSIHLTAVVQKKKSKRAAAAASSSAEDDLFAQDLATAEQDLFMELEAAADAKAAETSEEGEGEGLPAAPLIKPRQKKTKLSPSERARRFELYLEYVSPRVGRTPEVTDTLVKKRSLITLLGLAQSEAELKKVAELLPRWKEAWDSIPTVFPEAFVRRCHETKCPLLPISIFGDYAKYQLTLTLPAGQWLIYSLISQLSHPLEQLMVATALYTVYELPPVSSDLTSAAMVAAACVADGSGKALGLAEELKPFVEKLLRRQEKVRLELLAAKGAKKAKGGASAFASANVDSDVKSEGGQPEPTQETLREARRKLKWITSSLRGINKTSEARAGKAYIDPVLIPAESAFKLGVVVPLLAATTFVPTASAGGEVREPLPAGLLEASEAAGKKRKGEARV